MNVVDNFSKEIKSLFEVTKDSLNRNLLIAINSGKIKFPKEDLEQLFQVINISIEESYNRSIEHFQKKLSNYLSNENKSNSKK